MTVQAPPVVSEQLPTVAEPSEMLTVPPGVLVPSVVAARTVMRSGLPKAIGFEAVAIVALVATFATLWATLGETLGLRFGSPR